MRHVRKGTRSCSGCYLESSSKAETSLGCDGTGNNKSWDWLQRVCPAVDTIEGTSMMPMDQNVLGFSCESVTREGEQNEDKWSALHYTDGAG